MICSLIILADRGGLKAYQVTETPTRGPSLHLVDDFEITGSERELPFNVESSQRHVSLISDWPALETETHRRICKLVADRIAKVVETKRAEGWSFAAEPSVHKAIVDLLPVEIRERIVEHVPSDLVKIELAKLQSHFRSLQPIRSAEIASAAVRVKRPARKRGPVLKKPAKR
jgi:hypothetical protein